MQNDIDLALKAKNGDDAAFSELMQRHYKGVLNFVYRFTGGNSNSEDITQEVFLRVYRSIGRYEPEAKFTTWLYKIASNLCLTKLKKSKNNKMSLEEITEKTGEMPDPAVDSGDDLLYRKQLKKRIFKALRNLPEKERLAVTMSKYNGFSYIEISEILECTVGAVKTHIYRGRMKLVEELKDLNEE